MRSNSIQLLDRNLFMIQASNGVVVTLLVSEEDVLLLPVTSLSNPLDTIMFISCFRRLSREMCWGQ